MKIVLYQPEIPQNTGTILRLGVCLGLDVEIIEPMGFVWNDKKLQRSGMDYLDYANLIFYQDWKNFMELNRESRLVLVDTKASTNYLNFKYNQNDILVFGRESDGVPDEVFNFFSNKVKIIMQPNARSLNLALATAIVASEAIRQVRGS
jgi:tRNA (cytidine/uridine-2'-O-)-methyltransferase